MKYLSIILASLVVGLMIFRIYQTDYHPGYIAALLGWSALLLTKIDNLRDAK